MAHAATKPQSYEIRRERARQLWLKHHPEPDMRPMYVQEVCLSEGLEWRISGRHGEVLGYILLEEARA